VQICIWPSWFHCRPLSLASVKSRLVLSFWYRLTRVVPGKGPLNRCVCVCWVLPAFLTYCHKKLCFHLLYTWCYCATRHGFDRNLARSLLSHWKDYNSVYSQQKFLSACNDHVQFVTAVSVITALMHTSKNQYDSVSVCTTTPFRNRHHHVKRHSSSLLHIII